MPVVLPGSLSVPIAADSLDNEIVGNRSSIISVGTLVNSVEAGLIALTTRVTALENKVPVTPTPVAIVAITAAQEASLNAVAVGSVAILRGPTADFTLQRV